MSQLARALTSTYQRVSARLEGLTDHEFFWEPVPGCWSVRRIADSTIGGRSHDGEWVHEEVPGSPEPAPPTTIAWRLVHVYRLNVMYREWAFGEAALSWDDVAVPHTAASAIERWSASYLAFAEAASRATPGDLTRAYKPWWGRERTVESQIYLFLVENTHHGAEIGCLRDLFSAGTPQLPKA